MPALSLAYSTKLITDTPLEPRASLHWHSTSLEPACHDLKVSCILPPDTITMCSQPFPSQAATGRVAPAVWMDLVLQAWMGVAVVLDLAEGVEERKRTRRVGYKSHEFRFLVSGDSVLKQIRAASHCMTILIASCFLCRLPRRNSCSHSCKLPYV